MSSNLDKTPGTLRVVATPLGNPGDLSPRARQCLEEADAVLAEDAKRAGLACQRWTVGVKRFFSLHDHNEKHKLDTVLGFLREGQNLALISDAGMPVLSDPGYLLIRACREAGLPVTVVPGPCAAVTALTGSGIPSQPFAFFGFLPRKRAEQEKLLSAYVSLPASLVFYERKDRLAKTLATALSILGPRDVCVARELTKTHEQYLNFRLESPPVLDNILGEITVVIGPPEQIIRTNRSDLEMLIAEERPKGGSPRDVARRVQVRVTGWTTSEIYSLLPQGKKSQG
jgi:16S rRNA (cytidine1402-2'-O)-methyltransferase